MYASTGRSSGCGECSARRLDSDRKLMTWFRKRSEEIDELQRFVEDIKRGRTPATGDSLLETLRQIHDKREAPIPSRDHRQMLLDRLRREVAARRSTSARDAARPL